MNGRDENNNYILNGQRSNRVITPPTDHQPTFQLPIDTSAPSTAAPGAPYDMCHAPTSNPTISITDNATISFSSIPNNEAKQQALTRQTTINIANSAAQQLINTQTTSQDTTRNKQPQFSAAAIDEARRKYHTAWQNYYQKYYENYYMAALQEQKERFAKQQAEVVDSRENDGVLEQSEVQERLQSDIIAKAQDKTPRAKHHRPWFWPIIIAAIVIAIFLLLQFNSVIAAKIASFISPGNSSNQTIIVGAGLNQPVSDSPRIIIPKINVNAPVTYGLTDLSEQTVQTALQNGPINYPIAGATSLPGQLGNTVILGHSSADFFAPGDFKFIFVQLNRLEVGDLFYLDYGKTRYTYKVTTAKVINPNELGALNLGADKPYVTLVTCDPPGTIARRLLVIAEQVSPNPDDASTANNDNATHQPNKITGKPKTLLEKIFGN